MNAKLTIENITPKRATEILQDRFEGQRNLRSSHVSKLAQEIREGTWRLGPDCLVLIKGKLANGQHRLSAIIEAGKSACMIVMESNDDELYRIMDCGIKRTVSDALMSVDNANIVAAAAGLIMRYDKGVLTPMGSKETPKNVVTRNQIIGYVEANSDNLIHQAKTCVALYRKRPIITPSVATAILHIGSRKDKDRTESFIDSFYTGNSRDDAAWDMREKALRNSSSKAKLPSSYIFGLMLKSLKSYINGTRLGVLKIAQGEEYPKI